MFDVSKFEFTDADIAEAVAKGRLLSLEIEFNRQCNYRCPYCYAGEPENNTVKHDPAIIDTAIEQAAELGARKIIILGGEPLMAKELKGAIMRISELGMGTEIFTNGSLMTQELAEFFFRQNCRVSVKLNTPDPAVHDELTGVKDSLNKSLRAIRLLKEAGFTQKMLCASTVISSRNIGDVVELWKYLRREEITPYFEIMTPQGRLKDHRSLEVDPLVLKDVFEQIQEFDASLGISWNAQPPLVGSKCLRHKYSALLNAAGDLFPCVGIDKKIGNIKDAPLRVLLSESQVIQDLKNHREMIKGPCRTCDQAEQCYGCRGAAYQLTGDYLASDPLCWKNKDKMDQIQVLPVKAAPYLPHKPPMAMVDMICEVGPECTVSAVIRPDNRFLNSDGIFDRSAVPELVAQAGAACDSFRFDGRSRPGFLVFGHNIRFLADIHVNDEVIITIRDENTMDGWYQLDFTVSTGSGGLCAEGEVNVCVR